MEVTFYLYKGGWICVIVYACSVLVNGTFRRNFISFSEGYGVRERGGGQQARLSVTSRHPSSPSPSSSSFIFSKNISFRNSPMALQALKTALIDSKEKRQ